MKKYAHDIYKDLGEITSEYLDTYSCEIYSLLALYQHEYGIEISKQALLNAAERFEKLAQELREIAKDN